MNEKLRRQGFVQRARLLQLQRDASRLPRSTSLRPGATWHSRDQRANELQARIAKARNQYQQQATDETKESAARIRELEEVAALERSVGSG